MSPRHRTAGLAATAWAAILACQLATAHATEGGNSEYPLGVNTILPALLPMPGASELYDYFEYYPEYTLRDSNGNKLPVNFHLNEEVNATRLLHSWNISLGPFGLTSGIVIPVTNATLNVEGQTDGRIAFGDTVLQPIILGYNSPDHKLFAYLEGSFYVPDGGYSTKNLFNAGLNRYEAEPDFAVTWFPNEKIQASLFGALEIPFKNDATSYVSGKSVDFDYGIDYQIVPEWQRFHVGVGGYAFQQVSPDRAFGQLYNGGNYGRTIAVGPQIRYDWKLGGVAIKWQHEFAVENRPKGDVLWLQVAFPVF